MTMPGREHRCSICGTPGPDHHTCIGAWPTTIAGYIPMSPQLAEEVENAHRAHIELIRLVAIGPVHGPPTPTHITLSRRLGGHPTAHIRRTP